MPGDQLGVNPGLVCAHLRAPHQEGGVTEPHPGLYILKNSLIYFETESDNLFNPGWFGIQFVDQAGLDPVTVPVCWVLGHMQGPAEPTPSGRGQHGMDVPGSLASEPWGMK